MILYTFCTTKLKYGTLFFFPRTNESKLEGLETCSPTILEFLAEIGAIILCTYCAIFYNEAQSYGTLSFHHVERNRIGGGWRHLAPPFCNIQLKLVPYFRTIFVQICTNKLKFLHLLLFPCKRIKLGGELEAFSPTISKFRVETGAIIWFFFRTILYNKAQILYSFLSSRTRKSNLEELCRRDSSLPY